MHQRYLGTNVFHVRVKNERFTAADSRCRQKISRRHLVGYVKKNCTKKRAARAARLFFLIQPMKSLICGVVVAKRRPKILIFEALTTTQARRS